MRLAVVAYRLSQDHGLRSYLSHWMNDIFKCSWNMTKNAWHENVFLRFLANKAMFSCVSLGKKLSFRPVRSTNLLNQHQLLCKCCDWYTDAYAIIVLFWAVKGQMEGHKKWGGSDGPGGRGLIHDTKLPTYAGNWAKSAGWAYARKGGIIVGYYISAWPWCLVATVHNTITQLHTCRPDYSSLLVAHPFSQTKAG